MSVASLLLFAGALLVAAGSPGPSIAALTAQVVTRGMRNVLPFLAAMWVGEAVWLACAVFGLAVVAHAFQPVFLAIKYAGIAYLLWLAFKMWRAPVTVPGEADGRVPGARSDLKLFLTGLSVTLGNPKIMVFYLALLPSLIDLGRVTVAGWLELTAVMLVVLAGVDLAWMLMAHQARRLLRSPAAMRLANRTSAAVMAGAAAAMAAN